MSDTETARRVQGNTSVPVVGIGSSAGGVEACIALLKALPPDSGMAFVFVSHLDPSRESALEEVYRRFTSMPVHQIVEGTPVQPNNVYVIPRNCELTISGGILHLSDRQKSRTVSTSIDIFLRSLAADQGNKAIGVLLSGTGADGTQGLGAIKSEGGITFAQDSSAKYDSMPENATSAGAVDFVLPCERIAEELSFISKHPALRHTAADLGIVPEYSESRESQMAKIFAILRGATHVDFSEYKPPTVARRIARRLAIHRMQRLGDYVQLLKRDRDEVYALYQDLLINVTCFFRDPEAFETLKTVVYPELIARRESTTSPLRIWVPGCSTGEEAYSHAMALMEFLGERQVRMPIQIFGTDLSESAVQRARAGLYKETIEADVSPIRLQRFFSRVDSGYQIGKKVRDVCIFSTQNVFSDPPFSRIDLISCRNVMIYLSQPLQRRVIPVFHYALNRGGFLMVGRMESLLGSGAELFDMADKKQKIYRKKSDAILENVGSTFRVPDAQPERHMVSAPTKSSDGGRGPTDLLREADRLLLSRYAPPSVLVNDQLEIIQAKGHTSSFLELPVGKASLNLLKMARPGLLYELQGAIEEARKSAVDAVRANIRIDDNGATPVTVRVTPFRTPVQEKASFLITFEQPTGSTMPAQKSESTPLSDNERTDKDRQIAQLKQELAATKEYLQSIIEALESTNEELQSANEEIQSGNEELQSTNEELQTSKEELESGNEELHTVNEEMQHRNEQLNELNNDLTNLLNSVYLPIVMVGPDLNVRRFTPQAAKALGLTSTDIGRPITRLRLKIDAANLEQMMLDVIGELQPKEFKVRTTTGQWCNLRLHPYRTTDNRIEGVVMSVLEFED